MSEFPSRFNLAHYFLDHNIEQGRADGAALYFRDEVHTYGMIYKRSCQAAHFFRSLGLRPEERVLLALPDVPEFVTSWFATLRCGSVVTMVNPLLPSEDYAYYLDYTRCPLLITDKETLPRFEPILSNTRFLKHILVVGGTGSFQIGNSTVLPFEGVYSAPDDPFLMETSRDDIALWLFTSGTTGKPRAAVHMHHDFAFNTERYAKGVLGIKASDRTLSVPKLFFGYATGTNLMFPFAVGASTVLFQERSTPDALYAHIERYRPTLLTSVPTTINAMLNHPKAETADLSCLRMCLSAGEALPPELYLRWTSRFGVEILDGIGSAEMFHIFISNAPGQVKPGSLGRLVPGYEARIVSPAGVEVAPGEMGTLHIKGDSAALCYWNDHEKSKATFAGDWCFTSDQFRVDEEGYFWYSGRADDMLKVGGIWVSPLEVENCLLEHPSIAEVCVVGFDDGAGLVKPRAWIVLREGYLSDSALEESLKAWTKQHLAAYKYPRSFRFVAALPKNDRGKVERRTIREWS